MPNPVEIIPNIPATAAGIPLPKKDSGPILINGAIPTKPAPTVAVMLTKQVIIEDIHTILSHLCQRKQQK